jgi:hypothetical protein
MGGYFRRSFHGQFFELESAGVISDMVTLPLIL